MSWLLAQVGKPAASPARIAASISLQPRGGNRHIVDRLVLAVSAADVKLPAAVHAAFANVREMAPCGNCSAPPGLAASLHGADVRP